MTGHWSVWPLVALLMAVPGSGRPALRSPSAVVAGRGFTAAFGAESGSLRLQAAGRARPLVESGADGLWTARFRDGSVVRAADFGNAAGLRYRAVQPQTGGPLTLHYDSGRLQVTVSVRAAGATLEMVCDVRPASGEVLEFSLPARLRFDAAAVRRMVCPMDGNQGVGAAFTRSFFALQPADRPTAWRQEMVGTAGYAALFGGPLDQRADQEPAATLRVTPDGARWLGEAAARRLDGSAAVVNRPPTRQQADIVLVDSPNGPWLSGHSLGAGTVWRIGGAVGEGERQLALDAVCALVGRLATERPGGRLKVGALAMRGGPEAGGWSSVPVRTWLDRLRALPPMRDGAEIVPLETPAAVRDALAAGDFTAILNPYGEWAPALDGGMPATVEAVGRFVRGGGNWIETGGYPFFYALAPVRHFRYEGRYPALFADFLHLDSDDGTIGIYRAQPPAARPWDRTHLFVPGTLACGADDTSAYADRAYATFVAPGQTWRSPVSRLAVGGTAESDLAAYARANMEPRRLPDKMRPDVLDRFRRSVLVYYSGTAADKLRWLDRLPSPALIHWADYLHGGFDKQYPDHLPPNPSFGTPQEMREFMARARRMGHLVMPYTNPTWWCDHPKGPTFERAGDAPLLRELDGRLSYERYDRNDGYTVCHWHPAVQAASRRTREQFTRDYPVDVLFQDQCGARSWHYDTHPASPTPPAYIAGLLSMVAEDSRVVPLSTESGWDQVVGSEAQLCGLTWQIVPTEGAPEWVRSFRATYPPDTWVVYPLAQRLAHDRAAMVHHDLGQFVTNRQVLSWTLGLGFGMSGRIGAPQLGQDAPREWLRWLDRVQKSVCARYIGEPAGPFIHDRGQPSSPTDDGLIRARYGPVDVIANLGPTARTVGASQLAPYGFRAAARGMLAANVQSLGGVDFGEEGISFATEAARGRADVWVYAREDELACVELPGVRPGRVPIRLAFDGVGSVRADAVNGALRFRLPVRGGGRVVAPPPALGGLAPRQWPGARPAIGVLDLPNAPAPTWTRVTPADWLRAFRASRLAREWAVPVRAITSVPDLFAALEAGPTRWLAIVNPYGEGLPEPAPGQWRETTSRIARYVQGGGSWWETAGYSMHQAIAPGGPMESIGPAGLGALGLSAAGGELEAPPVALEPTQEGRAWLGEQVSAAVARLPSPVNRALPSGPEGVPHITLVRGAGQDYVGGYRLGGWGWLWRVGGFWPDPAMVTQVVVAATEHLYTSPPRRTEGLGARLLWHGVVRLGATQGAQRPVGPRASRRAARGHAHGDGGA